MAKAVRACQVKEAAEQTFGKEFKKLRDRVAALEKRIAKMENQAVVYEVKDEDEVKDERAIPSGN